MCRARFEGSLARPLLPQQRVKMLWRDAADPSKGNWYTGMVVIEAEEWAPSASTIWEGVSVMWDIDSSKKPPFLAVVPAYVCVWNIIMLCGVGKRISNTGVLA